MSVFGGSFFGAWQPTDPPDPFTPANGCTIRVGEDCDYETPEVVFDVLLDAGWTVTAPSFTGCACGTCWSYPITITAWETRAGYAARMVMWHHAQRYAAVTMVRCAAGKFKIVAQVTYSVTRIIRASERIRAGQRLWQGVCEDPGTLTKTVLGDWDYHCGDNYDEVPMPQLPAVWPQLFSGGSEDCPILTQEQTNDFSTEQVLRDRLRLTCGTDGTCRSFNDPVLMGCAFDADIVPPCFYGLSANGSGYFATRRQYQVLWESECIECAEIATLPEAIVLSRVSITPPPPIGYDPLLDVTFDVWPQVSPASPCPVAPAVPITIPFSLTVTLQTCDLVEGIGDMEIGSTFEVA